MEIGTQTSTTLAELVRTPRERTRRGAFLLLLTFTAGWVDALSYDRLGHVFSSFMTGNILFLGLSAVRGERAFVARGIMALGVFIAGALLGTLVLGRAPQRQSRSMWLGTLTRYLLAEWLVLLA